MPRMPAIIENCIVGLVRGTDLQEVRIVGAFVVLAEMEAKAALSVV